MMMPYYANSLISFFILASVSSFSYASNVDENTWDNLNARDRVLTEGLVDQTETTAGDIQKRIRQPEATTTGVEEDLTHIDTLETTLAGDETPQANRDRPTNQHEQPTVGRDGKDGIDGRNGKDGKDGVTTTIIKVKTDTITQKQVKANTAQIARQTRVNDHEMAQLEMASLSMDDDRADMSATKASLHGNALAQANRDRTADQHVQPVVGKEGIDGKNGVAGKEGATGQRGKDGAITTITRVETDTDTQQHVSNNNTAISSNTAAIRGVRSEQAAQAEYMQRQANVINQHSVRIEQNTAAISRNSQRIAQNAKRIDDTRKDLKRGLNNAAAMTGLHYHSNDAYALSAGTANGDGAALAGGLSHSLTDHASATAQASSAMRGNWMASVGFSGDF